MIESNAIELPDHVDCPTEHESRPILHVFATFGIGGPQVRTADIINSFGLQYRHSIAATDGDYACRSRLLPDAAVDFLQLDVRNKVLPGRLFAIHRSLRRVRPRLLLTYNWGAIEWALANTISPVCRHIHLEDGFGLEEANRQLPRRILFRRIALARTDHVVVPSETLANIAKRTWKLHPEKVFHIPNGIDWSQFAQLPGVEAKLGFRRSTDELIVGTVAPLRPEKNLEFLLECFAAIAMQFNAKLVIVGDGSERPKLAQLAQTLDIADRVHFTGHVEAVETVLTYFDVFALTSRTEQMPISILQAMAAAKPIVSVDVGDVSLMLSPENRSFVASRDDQSAFRKALTRLLEDPAARAHIGAQNQAHVQGHYPQDRMLEAHRKLLTASLREAKPYGAGSVSVAGHRAKGTSTIGDG